MPGIRYRIATRFARCSYASKLATNHSPLVRRSETNLSRISIESGRREENGGRYWIGIPLTSSRTSPAIVRRIILRVGQPVCGRRSPCLWY